LAAASPWEGYAANSIPRRNDPRILNHQDYRPLRRAGAVHNPSRHNEALPRLKLDDVGSIFDLNADAITFEGYDPWPAIKAKVAV